MPDDVPGYRVIDQVGQGGFSAVYRAHQDRLDRVVALKVLNVGAVDDAALRRFTRECRITGRLTGHPHVVTVLDTGMTGGGAPFIAMEYFEHGSLTDRLKREGTLPVPEVLRIGVKMASALAAVHEAGVLHRDVKPQNILVSRYGEPALTDFGVAQLTETRDTNQTMAFTPTHAAPEVLNGKEPRPTSDVYALGSTLYELLAGVPAFTADPAAGPAPLIRRIVTEQPPPIQRNGLRAEVFDAVVQAMAKDPDDRFPTAISLATHLRRLQLQLGFPVTELPLAGAHAGTAPASGKRTRRAPAPPERAEPPEHAAPPAPPETAGAEPDGQAAAVPAAPPVPGPPDTGQPVSRRDRLRGDTAPTPIPDSAATGQDRRAGAPGSAAGQDGTARIPGSAAGQDRAAGVPGSAVDPDRAAGVPGSAADRDRTAAMPGSAATGQDRTAQQAGGEQTARGVFEPVVPSAFETGGFGERPAAPAGGLGAFGPGPEPGPNGNGAGPQAGTPTQSTIAFGAVGTGHPGRAPGAPGVSDGATISIGNGGPTGPPGPGWSAPDVPGPRRRSKKGILLGAGIGVFAIVVIAGLVALFVRPGDDHHQRAAAPPPPSPVHKTSAQPSQHRPQPTARHSRPAVPPARIRMARPRNVKAKSAGHGRVVELRWKLTKPARALPLYVRRAPGSGHAVRLKHGIEKMRVDHLKPKTRYCFQVFTLVHKGSPPVLAKAHPACVRTTKR